MHPCVHLLMCVLMCVLMRDELMCVLMRELMCVLMSSWMVPSSLVKWAVAPNAGVGG